MTSQFDDTIVAISTPAGRGAIAIVRVSGARAHALAQRCLSRFPHASRSALLCDVLDPASGAVIERAIVTRFNAPSSFTGEDTVEISGHGGTRSPSAVAALLIREGARQAEPGEFTRRAVLNGKLDLLQAEAIGSIIDARTEASRRGALHHADGGVSRQIGMLRDSLLQLEALLAYEIDFPEEDDGPVPAGRIDRAIAEARHQVGELAKGVRLGELVRDGAVVVIAGRPNAGKSSLFNALLGVERAIVHDTPGTTRDAIEAVIEPGRWPLRLVDTAGLREGADAIERTGVEVSRRYLSAAQVVLVCGESADDLDEASEAVRSATDAPRLLVRTKADLEPANAAAAISVSAHQRTGLTALVAEIERTLDASQGSLDPSLPLLTRARHQAALTDASAELEAFADLWSEGSVPVSVAAVHLRAAVHALETLVGTVDVDDVLARVFSTFCVGK